MSNPRAVEKSRRLTCSESSFQLYPRVVPSVVVLLTVIAFYPVLHNQFVNWDDYKNIVENPFYRGLRWTNIQWMFTTFHMGHYQPLTWLTLCIDYLVWGLNPAGYHLSSLLFHCANAVVLYFVAFHLFLSADAGLAAHKGFLLPLGAGFAALLFSLHPLRVESVAWATERRDVVSVLFILLTVLCYLKATKLSETDLESRRWMAVSLGLYFLSLLSKATGMTLPLVLLTLDVYPLRRLGQPSTGWFGPKTRNVWREKIPFFVLALGAGVIALIAQYHARALRPLEQHDIASRLMQSFYGIVFYLWKTVLPFSLSPLYEVPLTPEPWRWSFLLSALLVVGITVVLFVRRRVWPAILASWIVYVVLLVPTSGIAQSGPQLVADRYSYLSCMAWTVVTAGGISHLLQLSLNRGVASHMLAAIVVIVALALVGFGVLTWKQTQVWQDSERLWRHALSIDPESSYAHNNLANALADQGRLDEATVEVREVLRINPRDAEGYYNLGNFLARQGKLGEAVDRFHEALQIRPDHAEAHYDLGNALARRGELDVAVVHFRQALFFAPQDARAHYNLGQIFVRKGKLEEAIRQYRLALGIDPTHVKARYYLAVALTEQGEFDGAGKEFLETLRIEPNLAEAHAGLARALSAQGKKDDAVRHYQEAVRLLKSQGQNPNEGLKK
jgi:protein O-mannosyl-transferase